MWSTSATFFTYLKYRLNSQAMEVARALDHFYSRYQWLSKFLGTKENVYMSSELKKPFKKLIYQ